MNNFKKIIEEILEGTKEEKINFLNEVKELNEDLLKIKKKNFFTVFPEYKKIINKNSTKHKNIFFNFI